MYKFRNIVVSVLVRRLRSIELQIGCNGVVDGFHLHCDCSFLSVRHVCLLDCSHNYVLRDTVGESELIEICLVLSDAESESLVALCILCIKVGEVDLLTLQLGVALHMYIQLCKLLCGLQLTVHIQRNALLLLDRHCACHIWSADAELLVSVLIDKRLQHDVAV